MPPFGTIRRMRLAPLFLAALLAVTAVPVGPIQAAPADCAVCGHACCCPEACAADAAPAPSADPCGSRLCSIRPEPPSGMGAMEWFHRAPDRMASDFLSSPNGPDASYGGRREHLSFRIDRHPPATPPPRAPIA